MNFLLQAVWLGTAIEGGVQLSHTSPDGDQGYPGEVQVSVSYTLQVNTPDNPVTGYFIIQNEPRAFSFLFFFF